MKVFEKEFVQKDLFITDVYDRPSGDGYSRSRSHLASD